MKDLAGSAIIGACLLLGLVGGAFVLRQSPQPGPGPTPVVPVAPLRTLVNAEAAAELASFYAAFSKAVDTGSCSTVGVFREAHIAAVKSLQDALKTEGLAAINAPIEAKLVAAVGLEDVQLVPTERAELAAALASIANDFGG